MSELSINSFEGGMNLDTSKVVHTKNTSREIRNFRPFTDEDGKAIGGLLNINGNELSFTYPTTNRVVEFKCEYTPIFPATDTLGFTINGTLTNIVFNVVGTTNIEVAENYVSQINANSYCITNQIFAYIVVPGTFIIYSLQNNTTFDVGDGSLYLARTEIIPPQSNLITIGWTTIRDDFYLFTTNDTSTTGSYGQIWKLVIDPITKVTTISNIYNNLLNFSTKYPIEAVGRYETSTIKKLYWTDYFNKVRTINVADPKAFQLAIDLLDINPVVNQSQPVLEEVLTGGGVKTGVYQAAYRLKTLSGGETSFSPLSRIVPINEYDQFTTNDWEFIGGNSGTTVGKSIRFKIENLDTNYSTIELVILYKANVTDLPTINIVTQETLTSSTFEYIYSGLETNQLEIAIDEFLLSSTTFTHAKTLTTKDNHLFVGNIKREVLNIPHSDFDARAYGFKLSSTEFEIDGVTYDTSVNPYTVIPEDADAVNTSGQQYAENSSFYGGTGPNISYLIKTKAVPTDNKPLGTSGSAGYEGLPYRQVPFSLTNPEDLNEGRTYPQPSIFSRLSNPHAFDLFRGYQRDEIYRFGIVFYDKQGNPGFVNWIADIKIPEAYDVISGYNNGSFRGKTIENISSTRYDVNIPYVEFTVNLPPTVIDKISGYSIVRVERTQNDKTILGQGLAIPIGPKFTVDEAAGANPAIETLLGNLIDTETYMFAGTPTTTQTQEANLSDIHSTELNVQDTISALTYDNEYFTLQMPESLLNGEVSYLSGDYIKTVDLLGSRVADLNEDFNFQPQTTTDVNSIHLFKKYKYVVANSQTYTANKEEDITNFWNVADSQEIQIDGSVLFRNELGFVYKQSASNKHAQYNSYGTKTLLIKTDNSIFTNVISGGYDYREAVNNMFIVNYKRPRTSQYGGNSFIQRGFNQYISTGNFISVDDTYTPLTVDVFGGDTFLTVFDSLKYRKNWDMAAAGVLDASAFSIAQGYLFPVESKINCDLRHGLHLQSHGLLDAGTSTNTDGNNNTLTGCVDLGEQYLYNKVYSSENSIKKFTAKPTFFNAIEEFDTRIYNSAVKINGETIDSWRSFKPNDYIDLESEYGPINKIIAHEDSFVTFQDDAISSVGVNPRAVVQGNDEISLELGTGLTLNDYSYLSTTNGSKHQYSVIAGKSFIYFVDIKSAKLFRVSRQGLEPISDAKGLNSYLAKNLIDSIKLNKADGGDNPLELNGVTGYYDHMNNEVVMTFHTTFIEEDENIPYSFTLVYNENAECFSSFYDFTSTIYPHNRNFIFSPNPNNLKTIYLHNYGSKATFYGTTYDSVVSPVLNDKPLYTKTFDNLLWHTESTTNTVDNPTDTFNELRVLSTYQSNLVPLTVNTNLKRKERTWQMAVPRNTTLERFRDKHLEIKLNYDNTPNNRFLVHYLGYTYRVSYR